MVLMSLAPKKNGSYQNAGNAEPAMKKQFASHRRHMVVGLYLMYALAVGQLSLPLWLTGCDALAASRRAGVSSEQ